MQNEDTENIELTQTNDESAEGVETQVEEQSEQTVEDRLAKAEADAAKFRRLFEKSQKTNQPVVEKKAVTPNAPLVDVDERILKANGMPDELLSELRVIAALRGVSVIDAQNDHLFVATKEKFDKDSKSKAASMGASRGSGQIKVQKTFTSPGLTREEHMAMIKEADIKI